MPRIRRNVLNLPTWDPIIEWYARAVGEMQKRNTVDPLSWWFQGAVHEFDPATQAALQALGHPGGTPPPNSVQQKYWFQCQHATWFFLPWHRAYLLFFEKTIIGIIKDLGGPADGWALPFWNYSDPTKPKARHLPLAFQQKTMPNGAKNPLFVQERAPAANSNRPIGTLADVDTTACLGKSQFENNGPILEFGGGDSKGFAHFGSVTGAAEFTPHNSMHRAVGGIMPNGSPGWMMDPGTAALDPIFWLHHSNIDRLWELWRRSNTTHTDPNTPAWLTKTSFDFYDENRSAVSITPSQMQDILDPFLDYDYEGLPPWPPSPPAAVPKARPAMGGPQQIPEMVGAVTNVSLGAGESHVNVQSEAPTGPAAGLAARVPEGRQIHLVLENVRAESHPVESYEVYVNVPAGSRPQDHPELMAGILAPFGVVQASRPDPHRGHGGDGINYSMDITRIAEKLQGVGQWDAHNIRVSFVPHRFEGDREREVDVRPLQVGRISLYYS